MGKMYQDTESNPLAGCLPSFAQIPIFISLYSSVKNLAVDGLSSDNKHPRRLVSFLLPESIESGPIWPAAAVPHHIRAYQRPPFFAQACSTSRSCGFRISMVLSTRRSAAWTG